MNTSQFQTDTSDGSSGLVAAFLCNKGLYAAMLSHHNLFRTMSKNRPTNAMVEFWQLSFCISSSSRCKWLSGWFFSSTKLSFLWFCMKDKILWVVSLKSQNVYSGESRCFPEFCSCLTVVVDCERGSRITSKLFRTLSKQTKMQNIQFENFVKAFSAFLQRQEFSTG